MITVQRKNNLFAFDHTHTHNVFNDGVQIGEISKHNNQWQFKSLDSSLKPIYVQVNERTKSTYEKLADGVQSALNRWNKADEKVRLTMVVNDEVKNNRGNTTLGLRNRSYKEVFHVPSGTVYKSAIEAAKDKGVKLFSLKTWLSKRQNMLVWAYFDQTKHVVNTYHNQ